jgi:hypothetical protein
MLAIEYDHQNQMRIYCDEEGLDVLLRELQILKTRGGHAHFMTPSWAGHELTEESHDPNAELIHHLLIVLESTVPAQ